MTRSPEHAARANLAALVDPYRSNAERDWARLGALILSNEFGELVLLTLYEPVTLRLPGGSYRPDFLHILEDGRTLFVEVKGSKKQKGYRDARSKLRAAAEIFSFWTFCEARGGGEEWVVEVIDV
jgi:hypothetical protein